MELIEVIKIAALAALVVFVISTIVLVSSFRSIIIIIKDSLKSFDSFRDGLSDTMKKLEGDVNGLNANLENSLNNVDNTVKAVYDTVVGFSELKERLAVSMDNIDSLALSLKENSEDASEFKYKLDETVGNINNLALQLSQTTDLVGRESISLLRAFKPFFSALSFVEEKFKSPLGSISAYFNAAYKAVSTFMGYYSSHKGYPHIKKKFDDIHIYTKDVDEQVHGPSYYDNEEFEYPPHEANGKKEARASDDFSVIDAETAKFESNDYEDTNGLLKNTYLYTEELLKQAEAEIDADKDKSAEEKAELKKQISVLREDILKSVKDFKEEMNGNG